MGVHLGDNQISDISALAGLTNLTLLELCDNQISDISPLAGLTVLHDLVLSHNRISDLSPLMENSSAGGLGPGDYVDVRYNYLDLMPGSQGMTDIQSLVERGVNVKYEREDGLIDW